MFEKISLIQHPLECPKKCPWHRNHVEGKHYTYAEIFPNNVCPLLCHSIYPYFLGLLYGAKFSWNEQGDCNVNCPAAGGVDVIVKKRPNDGSFDLRIPNSMEYVIHAEIIKVHDVCPKGHQEGDIIIFPTCMKEHYMCPAGLNNIFPLIDFELPSCIDSNNLRCPDWNDVIRYSVKPC